MAHNQKSKKTEDLRVRRTRKMIQQALMDLTVEKGFAAITVSDIAERAMINRSTFYRHYLDKYDLLEKYMDEEYELISAETPAREIAGEAAGLVPVGLLNHLRHIQRFADFYRVMLGEKGDPAFIQRFRQNVEKRFRLLLAEQIAEADPKMPPVDLRLSYVSYAGMGSILWWLENGQPCTPEQLAIWVGQLNRASAGLALKPGVPAGQR